MTKQEEEKQFDGLHAATGVYLIDPAELAWAEAFNKAVERARQDIEDKSIAEDRKLWE